MIREAWSREQQLTRAGLGWHSITAEAAGYLMLLLDNLKDAEEIATLREYRLKMMAVVRPITPIAIPLEANQDIANHFARVRFDGDGSGLKKSGPGSRPRPAGSSTHPLESPAPSRTSTPVSFCLGVSATQVPNEAGYRRIIENPEIRAIAARATV